MEPEFPTAVIVALPEAGHPLHDIVNPAEGGPAHMTLAYLGEFDKWSPEELEQLKTELRNISTDAYQFVDDIVSREKLGESQADVLKTNGHGSQKIRDVLTNGDSLIATIEEDARTFPTWLPHVTLGYPETPAFGEPDFNQIPFDRLALWAGEDREEFPLEPPEIQHEDRVSTHLKHHGVKGMKWGVRKDRHHEGEQVSIKKLNKLDKKFEKDLGSTKTMIAINNGAADKLNAFDIPRINAKPEYDKASRDGTLADRNHPVTKRYYKEFAEALEKRYNESASSLGTNASGTKKYVVDVDPDTLGWRARLGDVSHADEGYSYIAPVLKDGLVKGFKVRETEMTHDVMDRVDSYLEHYGVLGMKWGKRKKKLPSVDARRADNLRKKPVSQLTNKQLKELNQREELERKWKQAHPNGFTKGKALFTTTLATAGLGVAAYNMVNSPAGKAAIAVGKEWFYQNKGKHVADAAKHLVR